MAPRVTSDLLLVGSIPAAEYPVAAPGFADLVAREIGRLTAAVPPGDLAIQWDIAYETLDIEGVLPWSAGGAWDRYTDAVDRLPRLIPEEVLTGFHLCYGTFPASTATW